MKYYTNVVPTYFYSKLLEKGMPVNLVTYAEVFDWLMTKGGLMKMIYGDIPAKVSKTLYPRKLRNGLRVPMTQFVTH